MEAIWKEVKTAIQEFMDLPNRIPEDELHDDIFRHLIPITARNLSTFYPVSSKQKNQTSEVFKTLEVSDNEYSTDYKKTLHSGENNETLFSDIQDIESEASLLSDSSQNVSPHIISASTENVWESAKLELKKHMPDHSYIMWIEPIEFQKEQGNTIILGCPNFFSQKRVSDNYKSLIENEINNVSGKKYTILIEVSEKDNTKKKKSKKIETDPQLLLHDPPVPILKPGNGQGYEIVTDLWNNGQEYSKKQNELVLKPEKEKKLNGRLLRKDFTFDRFVVGTNNDFAFSASVSLASQRDLTQKTLFLLSETGNGKSHLSQAIGHHILAHCPSENVCYVTAEDFTNEMIQAIRHNSIDKFKEKYRTHCDVLILEDIHFLAGKERTQSELALALDYLFDARKKIIFTSCYLPVDIPKVNEQLRSRFSSGLITNIEPPDFRTRLKILNRKLKENGYHIPPNVADYLAAELSDNVRQLESGLMGVMAKSSLMGNPVDLSLAESVVKNIVRQSKRITIDRIKEMICEHFNISEHDIISCSRKQSVVRPRQIAIYLARKYTDYPLQTIGKSFNKYHATVLHSVSAVEKGLKTDVSLQKQVEFLCKKLEKD